MKTLFLTFCIITINIVALAQSNQNYTRMHTGTFTYAEEKDDVRIIRTETTQKEIYNNGKTEITLSISWLNDSTYVLTHIKSKNEPKAGCLKKGDQITSYIKKCSETQYTCRFLTQNCGQGECVIIKLE